MKKQRKTIANKNSEALGRFCKAHAASTRGDYKNLDETYHAQSCSYGRFVKVSRATEKARLKQAQARHDRARRKSEAKKIDLFSEIF